MDQSLAYEPDGIVARDEMLRGHAVLVAQGRVQGLVRSGAVPSTYRRVRLDGLLAPGFIDIHAHGAGGRSFSEADAGAHRDALRCFLDVGVTTVLPTLSAAPIDDMVAAIRAFGEVRGSGDGRSDVSGDGDGPRTPGMHLEGPYFSYEQRGAQASNALRSPDDGSVGILLEYADLLSMMSFAPELPGAVALTEQLVEHSIVAAAGHSNGRDTDLEACRRAGLTHVIHIVSGQSTTIREGPWRQPGILEATLASNGLTVEMIADGKHLPETLMRLAYRCLAGRLCLVSDAIAGAGLPDGERYRLGGDEYVVKDHVGMTLDYTSFAGSVTLLPHMVPIARQTLALSIPEAIAMVTSIPARAARLESIGQIAPGFHADFVLLDEELRVCDVALGGAWRGGCDRRDVTGE